MTLSKDLQALQHRWFSLPRPQQDELYAQEFAEPFARLFAELPLHGAPADLGKPRALVSVLGFSWQPVALMAAWCKPERMLVLGTDESLEKTVHGEGVLSIVARVAGISREAIASARIGDSGEEEIYRAVRDFLRRSNLSAREVFVDPTGGKKTMSVSAALAAFLVGAPLVHVDYRAYHGPNRIPVAGTEYPRLLSNPLDVFGDVELRAVFAAFNRSDFQEAERIAERLGERLYEPREAECLAAFARAYAAWERFAFKVAHEALDAAHGKLKSFSGRGNWRWVEALRARLDENRHVLAVLNQLTPKPPRLDDGIPLLAWYLAAAQRLIDVGKSSHALLLTHAAVERYVDLCLWVDFGLDDEKPDYAKVADRFVQDDCTRRYDEAGSKLYGNAYRRRELEGPLMFRNGAQLLAALAPERLFIQDLGPLRGLSEARNTCEYRHGFLPKIPASDKVRGWLDISIALISRGSRLSEHLERAMRACAFPRF